MWGDLLSALALMLVLEGLLPFVSPRAFREAMQAMLEMNDGQLRSASLFAMVAGAVLLYVVKN
jgi:uncharacterized protein YjeT (DUF2065 family)